MGLIGPLRVWWRSLVVVGEVDEHGVLRVGFAAPGLHLLVELPCPGEALLVQDLVDLLVPAGALRHLRLLCTALENRLDGVRLGLPLHRAERWELLRLPLDRQQRRARAARAVEPSLPPVVLLCLAAEEGRRRLKPAVGVPVGGALPHRAGGDAALALLVVVTGDAVA